MKSFTIVKTSCESHNTCLMINTYIFPEIEPCKTLLNTNLNLVACANFSAKLVN